VRKRFALDQNFPLPILNVLGRYMVEADLKPLFEIDPGLTRATEDWEIFLALHRHREHWDGLITSDSAMLRLPKEMSVLCQTKLTLVVAEGAGHDPVKASGLVLAHLPGICKLTNPQEAQLWVLRTTTRGHDDPWEHLKRIAESQGQSVNALFNAEKLSRQQLAK